MKNDELIALALAGVALWMILKSRSAAAKTSDYVNEIANTAKQGDAAFGWQYFSNGTVIDPDGSYWKDGRIVWAPGL
jgi:hypothetical protein